MRWVAGRHCWALKPFYWLKLVSGIMSGDGDGDGDDSIISTLFLLGS